VHHAGQGFHRGGGGCRPCRRGCTVISWARITEGWAINLDGTNAALVFSLPRIEVRSSSRGWRSECLLADGTRSECGTAYQGGVAAAKAGALAQAERLLGPVDAATLRQAVHLPGT